MTFRKGVSPSGLLAACPSCLEHVHTLLCAREEYLQAAVDQSDQHHGGMTAYLAKCGVTSCEIEALRELLVE